MKSPCLRHQASIPPPYYYMFVVVLLFFRPSCYSFLKCLPAFVYVCWCIRVRHSSRFVPSFVPPPYDRVATLPPRSLCRRSPPSISCVSSSRATPIALDSDTPRTDYKDGSGEMGFASSPDRSSFAFFFAFHPILRSFFLLGFSHFDSFSSLAPRRRRVNACNAAAVAAAARIHTHFKGSRLPAAPFHSIRPRGRRSNSPTVPRSRARQSVSVNESESSFVLSLRRRQTT